MKVLLLNQAFYPDVVSTAQHAADLAVRLAEGGHEVSVISSAHGYDNPGRVFPRRERWRGIEIFRIPTLALGKRSKWRRVLDFAYFQFRCGLLLATSPRYDVVIAMTSPPLVSFMATLFVRWKGGELVCWMMDLNPDEAVAAGWLQEDSAITKGLQWMLGQTLRQSSKVIALDRFMRARLLEKGADPEKVEVIPPWSHDAALRYDAEGRAAFRARHDLENKFVVMYSGNHSPCHPLTTLMESARRLADHPEIAFCFVGGGSQHNRVKEFAAKHRLSNILCLPYQPIEHLSASLASADLHVVVMGEAFVGIVHPCKIYNAMLLGIPILYIGPEHGHIPDLAPPQAHGTWFYGAAHGAVDPVVNHILDASSRVASHNPEEIRIAASFSAHVLVDKMVETLGAPACVDLVEGRESVAAPGISSDNYQTPSGFAGMPAPVRTLGQAGSTAAQKANWWPAVWITGLFLASYAVVLFRLAKQWLTDSNMSHGIFVPMLIAYIVWQKRREIAAVQPSRNLFGLLLILLGAALLCVGPPNLDTYATVTRISFVFSLIGLLLFLRGFATIRVLFYPLVLTLLMIPMPGFILEHLTFPLQITASKLAEHILEALNFSVLREGNILMLPGQTLNIAEACSGLRSLMALTFLGQAYAYLFDSRPWMRGLIAAMVIPIAIIANALRVVASAVAGSHNREWGQGLYHESTGWIVFVAAFLFILSAHVLTKKFWPEGKTV